MAELIHKLGIDWRLLVAQIINFLILFFVLKKFLYRPILEVLEKRRERVEKSLSNAERLESEITKVGEMREEIIRKANQKANEILGEARELAESKRASILKDAENEASRMIEETKHKLEKEKGKILDEAREDLAELVLLATEKVIQERLTEDKDKELIKETIRSLRR